MTPGRILTQGLGTFGGNVVVLGFGIDLVERMGCVKATQGYQNHAAAQQAYQSGSIAADTYQPTQTTQAGCC